jgi:hypothetical protein
MKFDPRITFWLGVVTTIAQAIASGTVHLAGLIPAQEIPVVTGWMSLLVLINMTILTAMTGASSNARGPLAPPPTLPEAQKIVAEANAAAAVH